LKRRRIVASNIESAPLDVLLDVIGESSQSVLISGVAALNGIEVSVEASRRRARSGNSGLQIRRSRERSSDEDVFFSSSVGEVRSIRISSSRSPAKVSSDDHRVRKSLVSSNRVSLISNRPSRSDVGIVSDSKSSFNVSGIGNEVSERNNVEVQPGIRVSVQGEAKSRAGSFPRSRNISRASNVSSVARFRGIARSNGRSASSRR